MKILLAAFTFAFSLSAMAELRISPRFINFGSVRINSVRTSSIWVQNSGQEATRVRVRDTFCRPDIDVYDHCFGELRPGASCRISVRFSPRRQGYSSCDVEINEDLGGYNRVSIRGNGVY